MSNVVATKTEAREREREKYRRYRARFLQRGICYKCRKPRGEDGTKDLCRFCADNGKEYRKEYKKKRRERWQELGLCVEHGDPLSLIEYCRKCRLRDLENPVQRISLYESLPPVAPDGRLESCVKCIHCGSTYYKNSYYYKGPRGYVEGPSNSLLFYETYPPRHGRVWSLCGICRVDGREKDPDAWKIRDLSGWDGICLEHTHQQARKLIDDEHIGEEGRGVWLRWSKRNKQTVPAEYEECGCEKLVPRSTATSLRRKPPVSGKCFDCLTPTNKRTEDVHIGEEGRGMWLRFTQEDENGRILIEYEVCGSACSRYMRRETANAYLHNSKRPRRWRGGICTEHVKDPSALLERRIAEAVRQSANSNGDGQKKESAQKRSPGHQPGDLVLDRGRLKSDFEEIVGKLRQTMPQHKILRRVITEEYNRRGEPIHETTVTKRVQLIYGNGVSVADGVAQALNVDRV